MHRAGAYNGRTRMIAVPHSVAFAVLLGLWALPAAAAADGAAPDPADEEISEEEVLDVSDVEDVQPGVPAMSEEDRSRMNALGQEFLATSSDMWFLLAGVRSREEADAAADEFTRLVAKTYELDEKMSQCPVVVGEGACAGTLDNMQVQILDSLENVNVEFTCLCRLRCYGSEKLIKAFRLAGKAGLFADEDVDSLTALPRTYTDDEAAAELARLKNLLAPDRALHELLATVKDAASAEAARARLAELDKELRALLPGQPAGVFKDERAAGVTAVTAPLERALWDLRNEIVRIAGLRGYSQEEFDEFSDELDNVFQTIEDVHAVWFQDVFDPSFRSDLEDAFQENVKTAND